MSMADKLNELLEQRLEDKRIAKQLEESVIVTPATTKLPSHIYDKPSWDIDWSDNTSNMEFKPSYFSNATTKERLKVCYVADSEKQPIPRMLIQNRGDDYEFRLINSNWKYGVQSMIENNAIVLWGSRKQPPEKLRYLIVISDHAKGNDSYWREIVLPHLDGMIDDKYSK